VWIPHQLDTDGGDRFYRFTVTGRLRSGITMEAARAQLALATDEFRRLFPGQLDPQDTFGLLGVHEALIGNVRPSLYVLAGAVAPWRFSWSSRVPTSPTCSWRAPPCGNGRW
jgi:putative ABC transport system permease protein